MMTKKTNETKQGHRKNVLGLNFINPEVNKFTIIEQVHKTGSPLWVFSNVDLYYTISRSHLKF